MAEKPPPKPPPKQAPRRPPADMIKVGSGKVSLSKTPPPLGAGTFGRSREETKVAEAPRGPEDAVFSLPIASQVKIPDLYLSFIRDVFPRILLPETTHQLLRAYASPDLKAERVAQIISGNPYYERQFFEAVQAASKREEMPSLEAAMVWLGMQNSRNLIIALQLVRMVRGTHPERKKDGQLALAIPDVLKYALRTEELLARDPELRSDLAFRSGLFFDALMLVSQDAKDPAVAQGYIEVAYVHGVRAAQVAAQLLKKMTPFSSAKHVFAAGLLHDIGKVMMVMVDPSYRDFIDVCEKRDVPRAVRLFAERKRFGVDHATLGALACEAFRFPRTFQRAVQFSHEPFALGAVGTRSQFKLAAVTALSTNMASYFRKADVPEDPVIGRWSGPELRGFKFDPKTLMAVMAKVVS